MPVPPRRRWFQFGLGAFLLWLIPYVAVMASILSWRDATPPSDSTAFHELGDAIGEAIFYGIKIFIAVFFTLFWGMIFLLTKFVERWLRRRDAIALQAGALAEHPADRSRRFSIRRGLILAAGLTLGIALICLAGSPVTQSPTNNSDAQDLIALVSASLGLSVIGAGIGLAVNGPKLAVLLGVTLPALTWLCVFIALPVGWLIQILSV